ncbi:MAG: PepSY domain-containing protein [Syntrophales bacterium]
MRKTGIVIGGAVVVVLAIGGLAISSQQAKLTGSITVKGNDEAGYAEMAKVSLDEAVHAALQSVPGKVLKVELEDEDGYLVYGVEIARADRQIADVKIDAGNGKLMKIDQDRNDGDDHEGSENSENEHEEGGER